MLFFGAKLRNHTRDRARRRFKLEMISLIDFQGMAEHHRAAAAFAGK